MSDSLVNKELPLSALFERESAVNRLPTECEAGVALVAELPVEKVFTVRAPIMIPMKIRDSDFSVMYDEICIG